MKSYIRMKSLTMIRLKIYLKRVRLNPENEILYSHEQFDYDKAKKLPAGVKIFNLTAFNTSWTDHKKGSIKEV